LDAIPKVCCPRKFVRQKCFESGTKGPPAVTLLASQYFLPIACPAALGEPWSMVEQLQDAGFKPAGEWMLDGEGIKLSVRPEKGRATVYIFVLDGHLVYIGKTETCFRQRMNGYRNPGPSQPTNKRVKALVLKALRERSRVEVLSASPEPLEWKGFPVCAVVGLEAGLISELKPEWNVLNKPKAEAKN
jgi:hypothetical protein